MCLPESIRGSVTCPRSAHAHSAMAALLVFMGALLLTGHPIAVADPGDEACCLPDATCIETTPQDCEAQEGTPGGPGSTCAAPQDEEACCFDSSCLVTDPVCCTAVGGASQGAGSACDLQGCCVIGFCLNNIDPECCVLDWGGFPLDPGVMCDYGDAACCIEGEECQYFTEICCNAQGGISGGLCEAHQACCFDDNHCEDDLSPVCCEAFGGTPMGEGTVCEATEACCLPSGDCTQMDPLCCEAIGGSPLGAGTICGDLEACCLDFYSGAACIEVMPECCAFLEGEARGPGSTCPADQACCLGAGCVMTDTYCCEQAGGIPDPDPASICDPGGCCFEPDWCFSDVDPVCCELKWGGFPLDEGLTCDHGASEACCDPADRSCTLLTPNCCVSADGISAEGTCDAPEACCYEDGTCEDGLAPVCCEAFGGTPMGPGTVCTGDIEACCLSDDTCEEMDPLCCAELGGTPGGAGSSCGALEACCLGFADGADCRDVSPVCCTLLDGVSRGPGTECAPDNACCLGAGCVMTDPACCELAGGIPDPNPDAVCEEAGCCFEPDWCFDNVDPECCELKWGGFPLPPEVPCDHGSSTACCTPEGTSCQYYTPNCCTASGGIPVEGSCDPVEACCFPDDTCQDGLIPVCCEELGGTPIGPGSTCSGSIEACCLPDNTCAEMDTVCCTAQGGTPIGAGTTCGDLEACCLDFYSNAECLDTPPECCALLEGFSRGPGTACEPDHACCLGAACVMTDPHCCEHAGGIADPDPDSECGSIGCCFSPDWCFSDVDPECCEWKWGGFPLDEGLTCDSGSAACCDPVDRSCTLYTPNCCISADGISMPGACDPPQACCFPDDTCEDGLAPVCCEAFGGTPQGVDSTCSGSIEACCFPDDTCREMDVICCEAAGGTPIGPGSVCSDAEACCLDFYGDADCRDIAPECCALIPGEPRGPGSVCAPDQVCCLGAGCVMTDPYCCESAGGIVDPDPYGVCESGGCCFSPDWCFHDVDPECCELKWGGFPLLEGLTCDNGISAACCDPVERTCTLYTPNCCLTLGRISIPGYCDTPQACCYPDNTCEDGLAPACCEAFGGVPQGVDTTCAGSIEACCLPDNSCEDMDPVCCTGLGGTPIGEGSACSALEACCFDSDEDAACMDLAPECCTHLGGTPRGVGTACAPDQACCLSLGCVMTDPYCCEQAGGIPDPDPYSECETAGCCFSPDWCFDNVDPECCELQWGGFPLDEGLPCDQGSSTTCCDPADRTCSYYTPNCCLSLDAIAVEGICDPPEACCFDDGSCEDGLAPVCCEAFGGAAMGPGTVCEPVEACCLPDGECMELDPNCCQVIDGTPLGQGTTCGDIEACCLGFNDDADCRELTPECCAVLDGEARGPGSVCAPDHACCLGLGCAMADPYCCEAAGGISDPDPYSECELAGCCFPPDWCFDNVDPECCEWKWGGFPLDEGLVCDNGVNAACCDPVDRSCTLYTPNCCISIDGISVPGTCDPPRACCYPDNTCEDALAPVCCEAFGGTPMAEGTSCGPFEACCLPGDICEEMDPLCCEAIGGTPGGPGSTCEPTEACCLGFADGAACKELAPACCVALDGESQGPSTTCAPALACCLGAGCEMTDPYCCELVGGVVDYDPPSVCESSGCCFGPDWCFSDVDPECCEWTWGGFPLDEGLSCDHGSSTACCDAVDMSCSVYTPNCCISADGIPVAGACTDPQACCFDDGSCEDGIIPACCEAFGGTPKGTGTVCGPDEACCMPDGTCAELSPLCCEQIGGTPIGAGSVCSDLEACCLGFDDGAACLDISPECCTVLLGTSRGPGSACAPDHACCLGGGCEMTDPYCCELAGGIADPDPESECEEAGCCFSPDWCFDNVDPECCEWKWGGFPLLEGLPCDAGIDAACCDPVDRSCTLYTPNCCYSAGGISVAASCDPPEACCYADNQCEDGLAPACCAAFGGTPMGTDTVCEPIEACCLPDDTCEEMSPVCCEGLGGVPGGAGTTCEPPEMCCLGFDDDAECKELAPDCCIALDGVPQGTGTTCAEDKPCCLGTGCVMTDPYCCELAGGTVDYEPGAECELSGCCFPPDWCFDNVDPECCLWIWGGHPLDEGLTCDAGASSACCDPADHSCTLYTPNCCVSADGISVPGTCDDPQACCLADNTCEDGLAPVCCEEFGGTPMGSGSTCVGDLEACCLPDDTCEEMDRVCCEALGGTPMGTGTVCTSLQACCLPDDTCEEMDPLCCGLHGGTAMGAGSVCDTPEACCMPDGTCKSIEPNCCAAQGGVPGGAGSECEPVEACCLDDDTCLMGDPNCCIQLHGTPQGIPSMCDDLQACCLPDGSCLDVDPECCDDIGGTPVGPGSACLGDANHNGTDDACETPCPLDPPVAESSGTCKSSADCVNTSECIGGVCYVPKNRYLSFVPANPGVTQAFRVITPAFPGEVRWVGAPDVAGLAGLECNEVCRVWDSTAVHVGDQDIIPGTWYFIEAVTCSGMPCGSGRLALPTCGVWGDAVGPFAAGAWTPPDGLANFNDVTAVNHAFRGLPDAPPLPWVDLSPEVPDRYINIFDLLDVSGAVTGTPYPYDAPSDCSKPPVKPGEPMLD